LSRPVTIDPGNYAKVFSPNSEESGSANVHKSINVVIACV
jgi:hypothetical protein